MVLILFFSLLGLATTLGYLVIDGVIMFTGIFRENKKMKQIITRLIEMKDYQFSECNTIKETLDQHGFLLQVFIQNQNDIMRQINGLCDYVQQMYNKLQSATSKNNNKN